MQKRKFILKRILVLLLVAFATFAVTKVEAASGYMYSSEGKLIESSAGYIVTNNGVFNILSSAWAGLTTDNGIESFLSPEDMCLYTDEVTGKQTLYVVDSKSNKLFIFDENLNYKKTISAFEIDSSKFSNDDLDHVYTRSESGTKVKILSENSMDRTKIYCNGLSGVFRSLRPAKNEDGTNLVDENDKVIYQDVIYLCDTVNQQIILLDAISEKVIQVVEAPQGVDFTSKFQPTKIVTDDAGRMYVISVNIYEGILLISYQGNFMRMVGVNYSTLSVWDALRRNFKTKEQLAQEISILQTTFNNIAIDKDDFIYTISGAVKNADGTTSTDAMIKKINQSNADVLKRNGYTKPTGDLITIRTGTNAGSSNFIAIDVNEYGVYTVIDSKNKRMFTYDNEGNLLYISGGSGVQTTDINLPVAIAYQNDNLLILDKGHKAIMRFEPTDFANKINKAVYYEYIGDADSAASQWKSVNSLNPAYELAYVGIGKKLLAEGRYQDAMLNFEKGMDIKYYSRAYKLYRDGIIKEYFPIVLWLALGGGTLAIVLKIRKSIKNRKPDEDGEIL